ncbi:MAG: ComEC/Rec2 family competence protein [Saprospiraceae bacterium]
MFRFENIPFLKIVFYFIIGILIGEFLNIHFSYWYFIVFSSIIFISLIVIYYSKNILLANIILPLALISCGFALLRLSDERNKSDYFGNILHRGTSELNVIISEVNKTKTGFSLISKVNSVFQDSSKYKVSGNLLIFLRESGSEIPSIGDTIFLNAKLTKIPHSFNPMTFDLSNYYHYKNIHYQCFLNDENSVLIKGDEEFFIKKFFKKQNNYIRSKLKKLVPGESNSNLAISIILGDRKELDKEIQFAFANTGISHILTVSGMHVGIVALLLNFIFSFFGNSKVILKILKIAFILVGIWYYAFLTGNQPAVMRASIMISIIIVGINIRKNINSLNILFASAFLLLVFNSLQLFQLSFILSYTAMLSILMFYKPIYELIDTTKMRTLNWLWQLMSLALAAQLLMYPLVIFIFHNGPVFFLVTTLIATPLAFLALGLGFLTVILDSFFHTLAVLTGKLLSFVFDISIAVINYIDSISINIGEFIYLNILDILLIYILLWISYLILYRKKKINYSVIAFLIVVIFINQSFRIYKNKKHDEIVFYYSKNNLVYDIFLNGGAILMRIYHFTEEEAIFAIEIIEFISLTIILLRLIHQR